MTTRRSRQVTNKRRRDQASRRRRYRFESAMPMVLGRRLTTLPALQVPAAWVWAGTALVALAALSLWFSLSSRFYVLDAQIVGADRLREGPIWEASGLAQTHILWVNAGAAARAIEEAVPSIERAEVTCWLPAECVITVVERREAFYWRFGEDVFWVDGVGGIGPTVQVPVGVWEISGPLALDEYGRITEEIRTAVDELDRLGVAPQWLEYRPGRGLAIMDTQGWRVVLGQGAGMDRRVRVYLEIREHLLESGIRPRFVDVRFPEAPYYSEVNEW